jgi:hypothetical protein
VDGNAESLKRHGSRLDDGLVARATVNGVKPFVIDRRKARLEFTQPEYEGMVVEARLDVDMRTFFELQALATDNSTPGNMEAAFAMFATQILESWNIQEEDGTTIPADADGFMALPPSLGTAILGAWSEAVTSSGEVSASA